MKNPIWTISALGAAVTGAIAASLCCIGPLVLLAFGMSSAMVSTLTQPAFIRPVGIVITLFFLGLVFWKLYLAKTCCSVDKVCAKPENLRLQRMIFWIVTLIVILLLSFPLYAFLGFFAGRYEISHSIPTTLYQSRLQPIN